VKNKRVVDGNYRQTARRLCTPDNLTRQTVKLSAFDSAPAEPYPPSNQKHLFVDLKKI
jgi:hypothetical protein